MFSRKRIPVWAVLGACFLVGLLASTPAIGAVEIIGPETKTIDLEIRKGSLVRLDQPVSAVFVADSEIADVQIKSPRLIYIFGKRAGETTLFAVDKNEAVLANMLVHVNHGLPKLREAISSLAPDEKVDVYSIDRNLVLEGRVTTVALAEELNVLAQRFLSEGETLINRLKVDAPTQVNLRVRIAEVSRTVVKQLGINWDATFTAGSFLFGIATGNPVVAAGSFLTRQDGTHSFFGSASGDSYDVNGLIDALADEGLITVLAEPNLTALSGEKASFLAGGEFPIPVPQEDGITIEFKQFGVQLAFTPVLLGDGVISLRVRPEVSQLSTAGSVEIAGFDIPALTTRQAETTVELGSGQSFAIAGLLQNNMNHQVDEVPGLGDIPVMGQLFRSDKFKREESELVIIVTPYLVRPVTSRQMAAPTDGFVPPNDIERILEGHNYGTRDEAPAETQSYEQDIRLVGPAGFMME